MNKEKVRDYIFFGIVSILCIAIIGITYAYFSLQVEGNGKDIVLDSGSLKLRYTDGEVIKLSTAYPGDTITKTVTVENTGTRNATYSLYWSDLINTIEKDELSLTMECKSYKNYGNSNKVESGTCSDIETTVPYSEESSSTAIKKNISIETGITQEYKITVTFENKDYDQSYNMKKSFTGKVDVKEYIAPTTTYCTFTGDLTQGAEFTKGNYTYRYKQKYEQLPLSGVSAPLNDDGLTFMETTISYDWKNMDTDGWGVHMSNEDVTALAEAPCTYINGIPVTSYSNIFHGSRVETLNVSKFDTSKVTDMSSMFNYINASEIKGLENFDTSNVTDMSYMFYGTFLIETLDLSNFDTSNVTDMQYMLSRCGANSLDLSNFDTSKVTNMDYMFEDSSATEIKGLNKFDTSNVTSMDSMFKSNYANKIDVSSFDTSNVTNMHSMFSGTAATEIIGYENFNTSKVINIGSMFTGVEINEIDISKYDTSNVENMSCLFCDSEITSIKGLTNLKTSNVTNMSSMFQRLTLSSLDLSNFDTSNVTNMSDMFANCSNLVTIYASEKFVTTKVTNDDSMFYNVTKLVGGAGTKYKVGNVSKTYARIDGGTSSPGYFTRKTS